MVFFVNFRTFLKFSKCKALGDLLISFFEITIPKGCLGGINQNSIFGNWFEILDIFRHWLLSLHCFPVRYRIDFEICLLTFKAINGPAPSYLRQLVTPLKIFKSTSALHAERNDKKNLGDRSFAVEYGNSLPEKLRSKTLFQTPP